MITGVPAVVSATGSGVAQHPRSSSPAMNSPQQIHPAEAGIRITFFRPAFSPEGSGISQICKMRKDMLIIDVALVGPSASRTPAN